VAVVATQLLTRDMGLAIVAGVAGVWGAQALLW
jgi:hypothetical protein